MYQLLRSAEKGFLLFEYIDNALICLEYKLPFKLLDLFSKNPPVINRRIYLKPVLQADLIIFFAMPGCRMNNAGALFSSYMLAEYGLYLAVNPRMFTDNPFKPGTGPYAVSNIVFILFLPELQHTVFN